MPGQAPAQEQFGNLLLPRETLDEYLNVAKISKKENRVMLVGTETPHSIIRGVAADANDHFIKLRDPESGTEFTVNWTSRTYIGITPMKLAKGA